MNEDILKALYGLKATNKTSNPAPFREYIAEIDALIAEGVKASQIEIAFEEFGFKVAPAALRSALYRYRKQQRTDGKPAPEKKHPLPERATVSLALQVDQKPRKDGEEKPPLETQPPPAAPAEKKDPWAYKSSLTDEEKAHLRSLTPAEQIALYREQAQKKRFVHNPTPERFRKEGE